MDTERPHQTGIIEKVAVGTQSGSMNTGDRANIIKLIGIASHTYSSQHFARFVADELAAAPPRAADNRQASQVTA
jgi:hypothetical protein